MISTTSPRYTIQTLDFSTRFIIRANGRPGCSNVFIGAWLCGWAIGEIIVLGIVVSDAIQALTGRPSSLGASLPGLLIWLLVWTGLGGTTLVSFLWQIAGREVIEISHDSFKIGRKLFSTGPSKSYNPINIDNLRLDDSQPAVSARFTRYGGARSSGGGLLVFDYGGSPVHFGGGLGFDEATLLLAEIQSRFPQYRSR